MFENLSERLFTNYQYLIGKGRLTEENIQDALREVRMALLEADVALPIVKQFIDDIKEKAWPRCLKKSKTWPSASKNC